VNVRELSPNRLPPVGCISKTIAAFAALVIVKPAVTSDVPIILEIFIALFSKNLFV
jgi:hypothetical protein